MILLDNILVEFWSLDSNIEWVTSSNTYLNIVEILSPASKVSRECVQ